MKSNLFTLSEALPLGTTFKQNKTIIVGGEVAKLRMEVAGSSWYFAIYIQKLSGNWTGSPTVVHVEAFEMTYQTANTTDIANGVLSTTEPYTPPTALGYSPALGATGVALTSNLAILFSETVVKKLEISALKCTARAPMLYLKRLISRQASSPYSQTWLRTIF